MRTLFINRVGFIFAVSLAATACGNLRSSRLDRELRAHGIYTCEMKGVPLAPRAEPRATHLRCYRDRVVLHAPKVQWVRSFYGSTDCTGDLLGNAEWSSTLKEQETSKIDELRPSNDSDRVELAYLETSGRQLTRMNPDWFLDLRTGCDLKRLELNAPAQIGYENACSKLLPKRELPSSRILVYAKESPKDPPKVIHGYWDNETHDCRR